MLPTEQQNESCQTEGACGGPRCPFARLFGTALGRFSLSLLAVLVAVHFFSDGLISQISFVAMWVLALTICTTVLLPPRGRKPKVA